jgi:hypothetical protein
MRANQIHLQFANLIAGDAHVAQLSDAGCDGIGNAIVRDQRVHNSAGTLHRNTGVRSEQHRPPLDGDFPHFFQGQVIAVDVKCVQEDFLLSP